MSERSRRYVRNTLVAASAVLALTGCSEGGKATATAPSSSSATVPRATTLGRCFDAPQPAGTLAPIASRDPITLHYDPATHRIAGEPTVSERILRQLTDSSVVIQAGRFRASGFATEAPNGQEVIVTAAHVVAVEDTSQITITDNTGHTTGATAGCYMYEDKGQFLDLGSVYTSQTLPDAKAYDIAILQPEQPVGQPARVATDYPGSGAWLEFVNTQREASAATPAHYLGLTVSKRPSILGDVALTGLEPQRASESIQAYSDQPGSSGGLAASIQTGAIEGMSYASGTHYSNAADTSRYFGVNFDTPIGPGAGIQPMETVLMGADVIHLALSSSNY